MPRRVFGLPSIREGERQPERVANIGLVNRALGVSDLFDATPDMVSQLGTLNGGRPPTAVPLTHGHIGHYTGLMYFGREFPDCVSRSDAARVSLRIAPAHAGPEDPAYI